MTFDTNVDSVRFVGGKFEVVATSTTINGEEETTSTSTITKYYDKCIWAAGMNGIPMTPPNMTNMFEKNFSGKVMHSSQVGDSDFEKDVQGKRLLLIGGSYSAEDLALMAIKCGVQKVYISARSPNVVSWTSVWPYDKVEVLLGQVPVGVTEDGRCIQFAATEDDAYDGAEDDEDDDDDNNEEKVQLERQTELRDIDTVIFCTGYLPNLDMLSDELRQATNRRVDEDETSEVLSVPKDWKMTPNKLTPILGDIEPDQDVRVTGPIHPGLYCDSISIENPQMMFMKFEFENPLFGIDVSAWLLLRSVVVASTTTTIPLSSEEMVQQEEQNALRMTMNNPYFRCMLDKNYFQAIDENWQKFPGRPDSKHDLLEHLEHEYCDTEATTELRILARYMKEARYPVSLLCSDGDELNETAHHYMHLDSMTYGHRAELTQDDAESGRTFRDYINGDEFQSVFTGTSAVSLKQRWLDIDAHDPTILE